jgi:hypothetical protein
MTDFETVKGLLQELQLAIVAEDPAEGILVVEDEERGLKHLDVNEVQGTIDAFSLALAEHAQELIAFSRQGTG